MTATPARTGAEPAPALESTTPDELVQRARALRPLLREHQAGVEALTHYPPEVHDALMEAGLYHTYIPRRYGGYGFDVPTYLRVLVELGRGCPSTAWCFGLAGNHALQVGSWFPEAAQDEAFGAGVFRAASVAAPTVRATREGDGWRLDGDVKYCSGSPWSTHYLGQALPVADDGSTGPPALFLAPRSEWELLDDWGTMIGLKGSGSNSIRFDGGRIADHMLLTDTFMIDVNVTGGTPGLELHGDPLYAGRAFGIFAMSLGAIALGAAYGALDEYEHIMMTQPYPLPPFGPRSADGDYQRWWGEARTRLGCAEAIVMSCADQHMARCRDNAQGGDFSLADDHLISAIGREAIIQIWETVEQVLFRTVGSTPATGAEQRFSRIFRDLIMAASHRNTMLRDRSFRVLAQLQLGLDDPELRTS